MVLYPGHPLVGRIVPVVRRYGRREHGQWIIELPDGSRQYVPISWCSSLSSEGSPTVPGSSQDEPPEGRAPSPLSLAVLRDLAAEVRRLQEEAAQRGEEQQHAGGTSGETAEHDFTTDPGERPGDARRDARVVEVGELLRGGSGPTGADDRASSTPPGGHRAGERPVEELSEP